MHYTQHFLNGKKSVSDGAKKKRGHDRTNGTRCVSQVNNARHAMTFHIIAAGGIPGAPDKELQEHHQAKARLAVSQHKQCRCWLIMREWYYAPIASYNAT